MLYNLPQNQEISNRCNNQTKKKHSTSHFGWDTKFSQQWKLTLTLLTWRIWWAPNNASKWQMGFNSAFKGLRMWCPEICALKW